MSRYLAEDGVNVFSIYATGDDTLIVHAKSKLKSYMAAMFQPLYRRVVHSHFKPNIGGNQGQSRSNQEAIEKPCC